MEEQFSQLINKIKYLIHEDNIMKFKKYIKKFEKDNGLKLNLEWNEINSPEVISEVKKKIVPLDLEKRLLETINYISNEELYDERNKLEKEIKSVNPEATIEEITVVCKNILNYLDNNKKRNKRFYYTIGSHFTLLKTRFEIEKEFIAYAKKEFDRSSTTLKDYIRFYTACNQYEQLLFCNLTYREIIKNFTEII